MEAKPDLLQIALCVHMTKTGSMERLDSDQQKDLDILRTTVFYWRPSSHPKWAKFDEKVRELLIEAICEPSWNVSHGQN